MKCLRVINIFTVFLAVYYHNIDGTVIESSLHFWKERRLFRSRRTKYDVKALTTCGHRVPVRVYWGRVCGDFIAIYIYFNINTSYTMGLCPKDHPCYTEK